jgi:hypothetical protein
VLPLRVGTRINHKYSGNDMDSFTPIWDRISAHAGSEFRQKTGRQFTYSLTGNTVIPTTTNRMLTRTQFQKAYERSPLRGPGQLQGLQGPSYLFAILTDPRVATDS